MTKREVLEQIKRYHGSMYNHAYHSKRKMSDLLDTLARASSSAKVTDREIRTHCQFDSLIPKQQ